MGHEDIGVFIPDAESVRKSAFAVLRSKLANDVLTKCATEIAKAVADGALNLMVTYEVHVNLDVTMDFINRKIVSKLVEAGYSVSCKKLERISALMMLLRFTVSWEVEGEMERLCSEVPRAPLSKPPSYPQAPIPCSAVGPHGFQGAQGCVGYVGPVGQTSSPINVNTSA